MSTRRLAPRPTTDLELVRDFDQRLKELEARRSSPAGNWRLVEVDGKPRLVKAGMPALDVGEIPEPEVISFADRGTYVTPEELAEAVTGSEGGLAEIQKLFENFRAFFENIDFSNPDFDTEEAFQQFVTTVVQPLIKFTDRIKGLIDISWLTDQHQNLVDESGYDSPITIATDDPNITHDATDGFPGSTPLGCMKVVANGAIHERGGDLIEVGKGWFLETESAVKWESLTATASSNAIRLELQPFFVSGDTATPVGSRFLVGAVLSPSGTSGGTGGWGTGIVGNYTVPSDGSVTHVALFPKVTAAATAGTVKFDNTTMVASQDIPQQFVKDLLSDLNSLLDWLTTWVNSGLTALGIPLVGDLFDKINDLADGISEVQNNADDALANLADIFSDLGSIFDLDLGHVPVLPFAEKVKGLIDRFFGGGPKQVVTQDQVAEASGIPPLDSVEKVPWIYLPPELTTAAIGHPWVELTKVGSQTISQNVETKLTAFSQAGGFPLTDSSSTFAVPFAGLFHVKIRATWANTPDTTMRVNLYRNGSLYRMDNRFGDPLGSLNGYNEVSEYVPLDAGDTIEFRVHWLGSGSTKDISVTNTYARITYIGATHLTSTPIPTPTVTFDAKGTADNGGLTDYEWDHTFGPNAKTIIVPVSHESPASVITVMCGPYEVPLLSGPTYVGSFSGSNSRHSLYGAILPDAVKGTTQTVNVVFGTGAQTAAGSANSLSFNNVSYIGTPYTSSGSSGPARLLVPSNAFSQVAGSFVGVNSGFSGFNRTQDNIWGFSAFNTWAHVIGHASGGLEFQASGGRWTGKFIELHP